MSNQLVVLGKYNDVDILARGDDCYVDVTALCHANGREWWRYYESVGAKRFIATLSENLGKPEVLLVESSQGRGRHTYADRRIALHCAAWISPEFEVWVYDRIEKLMSNGQVSLVPQQDSPNVGLMYDILRHQLEVSQTLLKAAQENSAMLADLKQTIANLPGQITNTAAMSVQDDFALHTPRTVFQGEPVPETFVAPKDLSYYACRKYVNDISTWVGRRWGVQQRTIRHILYNYTSDYLDFDIWVNGRAFMHKYGGNYSDLIETKGYGRIVAELAYSLWGQGNRPQMVVETAASKRINLTPVGERKGTGVIVRHHGRRHEYGNETVERVSAKVEAAKSSRKKTMATRDVARSTDAVTLTHAAEAQAKLDNLTPNTHEKVQPEALALGSN